MTDLISRDDAIAYIRDHFCNRCDTYNGVKCAFCDTGDAISALKDVPAVDAEPVRRGRWSFGEDDIIWWWICSECDAHETSPRRYCPECGAKMMDLEDE